ncbi:hypothetical protein TNIN_369051 [Trichonephila inaurata madagascariensis]|uniref:Uncharacterized protein n=1 Tax=Trichonephila inaurata madagascariensis TaxID=2747483 RepID=A0A8X7BPX2_9ARAC|nr:hypothetical protein TNIN_369051 [Trichonephila inaurata madagascariensis]
MVNRSALRHATSRDLPTTQPRGRGLVGSTPSRPSDFRCKLITTITPSAVNFTAADDLFRPQSTSTSTHLERADAFTGRICSICKPMEYRNTFGVHTYLESEDTNNLRLYHSKTPTPKQSEKKMETRYLSTTFGKFFCRWFQVAKYRHS